MIHACLLALQRKIEMLLKAKDAAQVYDVKVITVAVKQGNNKLVTEFADQLKSLDFN